MEMVRNFKKFTIGHTVKITINTTIIKKINKHWEWQHNAFRLILWHFDGKTVFDSNSIIRFECLIVILVGKLTINWTFHWHFIDIIIHYFHTQACESIRNNKLNGKHIKNEYKHIQWNARWEDYWLVISHTQPVILIDIYWLRFGKCNMYFVIIVRDILWYIINAYL